MTKWCLTRRPEIHEDEWRRLPGISSIFPVENFWKLSVAFELDNGKLYIWAGLLALRSGGAWAFGYALFILVVKKTLYIFFFFQGHCIFAWNTTTEAGVPLWQCNLKDGRKPFFSVSLQNLEIWSLTSRCWCSCGKHPPVTVKHNLWIGPQALDLVSVKTNALAGIRKGPCVQSLQWREELNSNSIWSMACALRVANHCTCASRT